MSTSAPRSHWNDDMPFLNPSDDTKALELGMSALNFVPNLPTVRLPALSGSSVSSAPDEQHHRQLSFGSFSLPNQDLSNVQQHYSTPPSPTSQMGVSSHFSHHFMSKNTSGISDNTFASFNHQTFGTSWTVKDTDSFDRSEDPDDDLFGLGAMRERSHSSPGPIFANSSSPPIRIDVNPYQSGDLSPLYHEGDRPRGFPPDPRRNRPYTTRSGSNGNSRPPLSGQSTQQPFLDSSFGSITGYGGGISSGISDQSPDYARSDMAERLQGRNRSMSGGAEIHDKNRSNDSFRAVDPVYNQGGVSSHYPIPRPQQPTAPRHIRSFSHNDPVQNVNVQDSTESRRRFDQLQHQRSSGDGIQDFIFPVGDHFHNRAMHGAMPRPLTSSEHIPARPIPTQGLLQRSISLTQPISYTSYEDPQMQYRANRFEDDSQRPPSLQTLRQTGFSQSLVNLRESDNKSLNLGGTSGDERYNNTLFEGRNQAPSFGYLVPPHARVRRHSDNSFSNDPIENERGGGGYYSGANHDLKSLTHGGYDDDLTHPLAGEDIDDPGDELGYGNPSPVFSIPYHLQKGPTYVHHDMNSYARSLPQAGPQRNPVESMVHSTLGHPPFQSAPRLVYTIKFKRTQRNFIPGPRIVGDLKVGCYVKVEADRGEDLGIVMNKMTMDKFCSMGGRTGFRVTGSAAAGNEMGMLPASTTTNLADLKRVVRLASQDEVSLLSAKREEEEELLRICREKVEQRALPMHVVDAEYQFDRNKLTFFFEAESRIDFRELVRDLFSIYKTRIWMQQLDKNSNNSAGGSPRIVSPNVDYASSQQQIPIMADSIHDPYGIPQNEFGGAR